MRGADNCRNTFGIASILHRHLDLATPLAGLESLGVRWREADDPEVVIVCETVHRVKGLEFDFVVLVADDDVSDLLLYVGLSRALVGFSLVAPATAAARLGLPRSDRAGRPHEGVRAGP